jgi:hypothetical protein
MHSTDAGRVKAIKYLPKIEIRNTLLPLYLNLF